MNTIRKTIRTLAMMATVLAAMLALSPVGHAAPPLESYIKVSIEGGTLVVANSTFFMSISASRIKSALRQGGETATVLDYHISGDRVTIAQGSCTIPDASLIGNVMRQNGTLSLRNINTASLEAAGECSFKSGSDLIISSIDWASNGISITFFDGTTKQVVTAPDGQSTTTINTGKGSDFSATAQVNLTTEAFGLLTGTAGGLDPTIDGSFPFLSNFGFVDRSVERTRGAPSPAP